MNFLKYAAASSVIAITIAGGAIAQTTTPAPVPALDLTPYLDTLLPIVGSIVLAVLGWLSWKIKERTGFEIDATAGGILDTALKRALQYAKTIIVGPDGKVTIEVQNEIVRTAAEYALKAIPDVLKHFGITPDRLRELIIARLPTVS